MSVESGAAAGATVGSVVPGIGTAAGAIGGAVVGGVGSLLGANKNAKASKSAGDLQAKLAREAMAEQKRIYDLEAQKDEARYQTERKDKEYDRAKTLADESRVRASRGAAFGGFGSDLASLSKGYAPVYGMSAEQSQGLMDARNAGFSGGGGGRAPVAPQMGDKGLGQGPDPMDPSGPQVTQGPWNGPALQGPTSASMGSSVWLKAPTGETMQVSIQDAPKITKMLQAGAVLVPAPTGGS